MTGLSKEHEIKTMEQKQCLQLKMLFYGIITCKLLFSGRGGGGNKDLVGVFFLVG